MRLKDETFTKYRAEGVVLRRDFKLEGSEVAAV